MPKSKTAERQPQEFAALQVPGQLLKRVSQIPSASLALVCALGQAEGARYLLPFIDLSLAEDPELSEAEGDEALAVMMTLDNAAHLTRVLAVGLASAFKDYEQMLGPNALPEPTRLRAVLTYLKDARSSIDALASDVERVLVAPPPHVADQTQLR